MSRITKVEAARRRDEIHKCLLDGWRTAKIVKYYTELWKCSHQNIRKYITAVQKEIADSMEPSREWRRKLYVERLEGLFHTCLEKENYKTALDVQKELNSITRVKEPENSGDDAIEVITISSKEPKAIEAKSSSISDSDDDKES